MMLTFPSCYCETNFNMKMSSEQDFIIQYMTIRMDDSVYTDGLLGSKAKDY